MSQYDFGTIDPYVMVGVELADALNKWRDAIYSMHRGGVRPSYVVPGQMWVNDSGGANAWIVEWYVSPTVGDVPMFTLNTTTGAVTVNASAGGTFNAAVLLAQAAASPSHQWNATGNPIDQKNWRMTVNAVGALVLSSYSDAGVLQQSITFGRDGSVSGTAIKPSVQLYSEQLLAANGADLRVPFPAAAKKIELEFFFTNVANADGTMFLGLTLAGAPQTPANYNSLNLYGAQQPAGTTGSVFNTGQVAWLMTGSGAQGRGMLQANKIASGSFLVTGHWWIITNGGLRYVYTGGFDGGATSSDGFRLFNSGGAPLFQTGSFLRCYAI